MIVMLEPAKLRGLPRLVGLRVVWVKWLRGSRRSKQFWRGSINIWCWSKIWRGLAGSKIWRGFKI